MLARFVSLRPRSAAARVPSRRGLLPRETLIALVVASPLLAILLSKNAIYGPWSARLRFVAGAFAYAAAIAVSLHALFDGLLVRLPRGVLQHPVRFVLYWITAVATVAGVTAAFAPVFAAMNLSFDPVRRDVQGGVIVSFYLAAALLFKRATRRIADEQSRAMTARAAALDARFQALQARTNPHFLFNTLNSIMSLIGKDPAQAEQVVGQLATLMRYAIEGADRSHVSLREELSAVRDYLAIEQVRFGERLAVEVQVADDVNLDARVPPMILQPLVENAVLHGASRSVAGGLVRVTAAVHRRPRGDEGIELTVDDDGASAGASPHLGTGTSLSNLHERLQIVYGEHAGLAAGRRPGGGFRARLTLPGRIPS